MSRNLYQSGVVRPGWTMPEFQGREVDFDATELQDITQNGIKVQLGPKTLALLTTIRVPDASDKTYLKDGRPQRTVEKKVNIADLESTAASLGEKILAVKTAIADGAISTTQEIGALKQAVDYFIEKFPSVLQNIPAGSAPVIESALNWIQVSGKWQDSFNSRYIKIKDLYAPGAEDRRRRVIQFLVSNLPLDRSMEAPVYDESKDTFISIVDIGKKYKNSPDMILDLEDRNIRKDVDGIFGTTSAQSNLLDSAPIVDQSAPLNPPPTSNQFPVPPPPPPQSTSTNPKIKALETKINEIKDLIKVATTDREKKRLVKNLKDTEAILIAERNRLQAASQQASTSAAQGSIAEEIKVKAQKKLKAFVEKLKGTVANKPSPSLDAIGVVLDVIGISEVNSSNIQDFKQQVSEELKEIIDDWKEMDEGGNVAEGRVLELDSTEEYEFVVDTLADILKMTGSGKKKKNKKY